MTPSLYSFSIDPEHIGLCNDICHKWVLLTVYQILYGFNTNNEILSDHFVDGMCFLTIGIVMYWIIFRKVVQFTERKLEVQ